MAKILIVDDEKNIRSGLAIAFEDEGYDTAQAEDGEQAWSIIQKQGADLVVTDLRMPVMSGYELLKKISGAYPTLPVIVLTGHGTIEDAVQAMREGAVDFFTKPVSAERLAEACRRLFDWNVSARRERAERARAQGLVARLTPREKDVALAASTGAANKTIAKNLGVSEQAVKIHRSNVYAKLEVHSAVEIRAVLERAGAAKTTDESRLGAVRTQLLPVEEES